MRSSASSCSRIGVASGLSLAGIELPLAEQRRVALGPVNLVQIQIVGLQPREAGVDRGFDLLARELGTVADPGDLPRRTGHLGGQHDLVARLVFQPRPDVLLGLALRMGAGRDRIHLGGVDEVHAVGHRIVELRMRLGFGVLLTPGHGAQADLRYIELAGPQFSVLQTFLLKDSSGTRRPATSTFRTGRAPHRRPPRGAAVRRWRAIRKSFAWSSADSLVRASR